MVIYAAAYAAAEYIVKKSMDCMAKRLTDYFYGNSFFQLRESYPQPVTFCVLYLSNTQNLSMLKITFFLILLFSVQLFSAQTSSEKTKIYRLSVSYSLGYQHLRMGDINRYFLDTFAIPNNLFQQNIRHSMYRNLELSYHFSNYLGFGISVKSNEQSIEHVSPIYFMDDIGNITDTIYSNNRLGVRNNSFGIFAQLDCGKLLDHFAKRNAMKDWQMQLLAGATLNTMYVNLSTNSSVYNHENNYFAPSFGWNSQVKISYPLLKWKNSQLRLGLTLGYQHAKTKQLRTDAVNWIVLGKYPITADFSGFNAGIGLNYEINHRKKQGSISPSKNAVYLDIFGQSLYGALMYERIQNVESTGVQHGLAAGFIFLNRIPWDYLRVLSIPLAFNAYFDFNRRKNSPHKLELGFGITVMSLQNVESSNPTKEQYLFPSARIGYCYHSYQSGLLFKATFTPALAGIARSNFGGDKMYTNFGSAAFFDSPAFPWIGISIGKTF